jgi:hypothetical protein
MRRIGVLISSAADDPAGQARLLAVAQALAQLGSTISRGLGLALQYSRRELVELHCSRCVSRGGKCPPDTAESDIL